MKGAALFGILVVSILIMGGSFYYFHAQDQKVLPKFSISLDFKDNSSFNASYPITLSGVPSGSGTYQQLITLNNYSKYGINDNGSNIEFFDAFNLTHLYAWIQSINATSIQLWVKNYNGSGRIDLEVLAKSENLFSSTGYLGEAPQLSPTYAEYDNGKNVFLYYDNYKNASDLTGYSINSNWYNINNGLKLYGNTSIYYSANGYSNLTVMGINAQYYTNESTDIGGWVIYTGFPNPYTIKITNIQQTYVHYGGYPYAVFRSPYKVYNSSYFSDFMIIPINYTSQSAYYNNSDIGKYNVSTINSIYPQFVVNDGGYPPNSTFLFIHYFYFANPLVSGMPGFTIGSAYHPLSSFSISSNSLVVNTTFMEHNLTGYQYYAFSPVYNGNPVWFLVNGQIGDRLSVLLDGNVSLTVQILGYSYSNIIKEVKVE